MSVCRFCAKNSDWFVAWVNAEELVPPVKDCLLARFAFSFDNETGLYHDAEGVTINSNVDFGNVGGIAVSGLPLARVVNRIPPRLATN